MVKLVVPTCSHDDGHPHGVPPPDGCRVVDLGVHQLHIEAGGHQIRIARAEMVEVSGHRLVEPGEVVGVEDHVLLVDLREPAARSAASTRSRAT